MPPFLAEFSPLTSDLLLFLAQSASATPTPEVFSPVTKQVFEWIRYSPFVGILLSLVVIDVITGTAWVSH